MFTYHLPFLEKPISALPNILSFGLSSKVSMDTKKLIKRTQNCDLQRLESICEKNLKMERARKGRAFPENEDYIYVQMNFK